MSIDTTTNAVTLDNIATLIAKVKVPSDIAQRGEADDFRQEIAVDLLSHRIGSPIPTALRWSKAEAAKALRPHQRRTTQHQHAPLTNSDEVYHDIGHEPATSDTELRDELHQAIYAIPDTVVSLKHRKRAIQRWLRGWTVENIAAINRCSESSVFNSLRKVREALATRFDSITGSRV